MKNNSSKQHWEGIYEAKDTTREVSWYQNNPETSTNLILSTDVDRDGNIIDIGGGDSKLVDKLLSLGFKNIFVLDISARALQKAKNRLGEKAELITWVDKNVLDFDTSSRFDIWHDRAAFHFLTREEDIARYVKIAEKLTKQNGHLIISTFSKNGPKKCSGLYITQYSENSIKKVFEKRFDHVRSFEETHITPFNTKQIFLWSIFKKVD